MNPGDEGTQIVRGRQEPTIVKQLRARLPLTYTIAQRSRETYMHDINHTHKQQLQYD